MVFIRSLIFQLFFYANFLLQVCATLWFAFFLPRKSAWRIAIIWVTSSQWLWEKICGASVEIRGRENIPQGGFIIASKHQSAWETMFLIPIFKDVVYILKRELTWLPFFGWYLKKTEQIPINRGRGAKVIGPMTEAAEKVIKDGRAVLIFPEGTRIQAGKKSKYKTGVARLAKNLNTPILPVALNTGLFWPRNSFLRYPGKVIVEILPPIHPKDTVEETMLALSSSIETATTALIMETAASKNPPETVEKALENLSKRDV